MLGGVGLRNLDLNPCHDASVVEEVLRSKLDEVDFVVSEDVGKADGTIGTDAFLSRFELVQVLPGDIEACGELRERLLVRLANGGE